MTFSQHVFPTLCSPSPCTASLGGSDRFREDSVLGVDMARRFELGDPGVARGVPVVLLVGVAGVIFTVI